MTPDPLGCVGYTQSEAPAPRLLVLFTLGSLASLTPHFRHSPTVALARFLLPSRSDFLVIPLQQPPSQPLQFISYVTHSLALCSHIVTVVV